MGATRAIMTMAVLAIGAGGLLAIATIPALAPYQQRKPDRESMPIYSPNGPAPRQAETTDGYALAEPQAVTGDEFRADLHDGAIVIELPRWAREGGEWVDLGRRAWNDWVQPGEDGYVTDSEPPSYGRADRREWNRRDDGESDYREFEEYGPRRDRRWNGGESEYTDRDRSADVFEPPLPPLSQAPENYADVPQSRRDPGTALREAVAPLVDAAALAAERARKAARDVRAAEDAQ